MKGSRITAVGLVAAAGLWIASGHFIPHENPASQAAVRPSEAPAEKLFRVSVQQTQLFPHARSSFSPAARKPTARSSRHRAPPASSPS